MLEGVPLRRRTNYSLAGKIIGTDVVQIELQTDSWLHGTSDKIEEGKCQTSIDGSDIGTVPFERSFDGSFGHGAG